MVPVIEKYLELVKDYRFSDAYNVWAFIACAAACLERRVWLNEHAIGYLYPTMYVVFVGPPAARKTSTARVPVEYFLRGLSEGPIVCSNQLTPAALIDELQAAGRIRHEHKTSPLFVFAPEFGVWFKDIGGGSMTDLLLEFYDSRQPGEVWQKNTKKYGKQEMMNPALTILGCTTPKEMMNSRLSDTAGIGFTSRVIFVCEPRFIPGTTRFPQLDPKAVKELQTHFYRLMSLSGPFVLGPGTEEAIEGTHIRVNQWMEKHPGTTIMANYMARKPVQIRKVAMCLAAFRGTKKIILPEDILEAEHMMTALEPTLPTAFGMQITYQDPALASKILDKIPLSGIISDEALMNSFFFDGQAVPNNNEIRDVISGLVRSGVIEIFTSGEGKISYKRKAVQ